VRLTHKRILFVDDEPAIRATLAVILGRYGFAVTVAATVAQGIDLIKAQEFDLLLCDLNIEGERDGYTVIKAMRQANPNCINIVLTGYPDEQSAAVGLELGIDDYIAKPANADALVAILAEKLAKRNKAETT
jgi:DNA-binding response OmpR family regulator